MRSTTRIVACTGAVALAAAASSLFVTVPASATPASDATFATANEQSNLAEISLAALGKAKGQDSATLALAAKTKSDHMQAKTKLATASKGEKLALPTAPNAAQMAVAASLKAASVSSFDLMFAQAEVTGHEQALAAARAEQASTSNAQLKSYTTYYVGIASMHLSMAQAEVAKLGGTPNTVAAGSGGAASTGSSLDPAGVWGIGAGAVLIVAGAATAVTRRRGSVAR